MALVVLAAAPLAAQSFARVVGTVHTQAGEPLEGVTVCLYDGGAREPAAQATSDARGRYSLKVPDAGRSYLLRFAKEDYLPTEERFRAPRAFSNTVKNVVLAAAERRAPLPTAADAFNAGVAAFNAGDYDVAETNFSKALAIDPALLQAQRSLAQTYLRKGEYPHAIKSAECVLAVAPEDQVALSVQVEAYRAEGENALADEASARLSAVAAPAVIAYNAGKEAVRGGDLEAAGEHFSEAVALDPTLAAAHEALAFIHLKAGDYASAEQEARRVLELEKDNSNALTVTYDACRALGEDDEAAAALERMYVVAPDQTTEQFFDQAMGLFDANQIAEAAVLFEQILEHRPDHARSHYMLGLCLVNAGKRSQAAEQLERFLDLAPHDFDAEAARDMLKYLNQDGG